ncbi:MAG: Pr6Pr family membrane protein [Actinobacteria bacterium]|nr:Pr6Pr family membrane protein [Actinomycetota bacterium]MCI0543172.1 Pr6Pr family membrane protein [Actinomycetota bacterium]
MDPSGDQWVMGMGTVGRVLRGFVVVLIIAATVQAYGPNLFFYFTILSNTLAAVLLAGEAIWPEWMGRNANYRGAVTVYMTITGLVYALLLAPLNIDVGDYAPWANFVHHNLAPAALLIDWLLFPPRQRLDRRAPMVWLVFPVVYFTFSLIRGSATGFFPYPFLDLDLQGVGGVLVYAIVILAVFIGVGWFVRWWAEQRGIIPVADGVAGLPSPGPG